MNKKLTILDIAKLADVGKSTVSRVLTNDPKVKAQTREKVEKIIRESGYTPSKSAQSMRGGSQKVVGIIISRLDSPSENRVVATMLSTLYAAGYDVVIMESQFDRNKTNEHLAVLKKRNVDGVIVFGFTGCDENALAQWGNRVVAIAMDTQLISSINYDNQGVIEHALAHVHHQSISRISYIGVDPEDKTTGLARLTAYKKWCKNQGITPCYKTGKLSHESAYQLVDEVLKPDTQAIICASDTIALGVAKRLQEIAREDVVITGVGGNELLSFLFPKIFSVDPGYACAGKKAADILINQLNGNEQIVHYTQQPIPH
ncbi:trehalose operon repressor TreR [Photobacterium angustum]|uniref:HTH-type transcriptional regulator TreR n=1 Tax=Photobacterium angustum TaxID=661 RepID=A0A855S8F3_PHOAN|nr:trehalose operon repressor TreR [Photobacterium angustum]KJF81610.1 trehalose repressor [Photobacterium damselae subsp. damselae]KJG40863.1 trehalose repressor [Photobacterium angustum]KJG45256.1 trehalose repressor [Photobacterium angustum]KJG48768.1 trehalose repressor [Photobacterium angustum]KJG52488.1 trehalose repressor [Photobacterium angustum]